MAKFISFCSQKGGVGKTSITTHVATYFYQVERVPVAIFDCDFPQHSLQSIRTSEIARLKSDEGFFRKAEKLGQMPYPIYADSVANTLPKLDAYATKNELVLVDLPGTLNVEGMPGMIQRLDAAVLLLEADPLSFESTMHTVLAMAKFSNKNGGMVPTYLLWNKFDSRERKDRYSGLEQAALNYLDGLNASRKTPMNVHFMEHRIPDTVAIKDTRSTLFPNAVIKPLIQELNKLFVSNSPTV
ncbi:ParA family protein [Spirosoma endophyticum]|uniref:Chromosome partitioning protein n=1 Tax=Spirosoma endophyticum TaxID=662367 RepID=A0A1I1ZHW3_9BACT|nr:ParA family protein [Spirosoma endophyticum]SFE31162.1 chromosome partitioning protein [Spirosoma endophyticum]